jgi:[ribosomal protein S5]-alanine N-acetyltransferase
MGSHTPFDWGSALPVLDAGRVVLRPLHDADVPALFEIFGDAEAMRYWGSPPLPDLEGAHGLLADIRRHFGALTLFQWGVARRDNDEIIGTTTIFQIDYEHRRGVIGFAIRRRDWGRGYASEAVTALIRFAFERLGLHRLEADPDPHNAPSIAVLEKQGFRREGLLRERYFLNGEPQDAAYYGLLRPEWSHSDDVQ